MTPQKRCSKCETEKPLSEFYKNLHLKSGYFAACKTCVKARQIVWNKSEDGKSSIQKFKAENREKLRAYVATYGRSEKGKKSRKKYKSSPRGKEVKKNYLHRRYGGEQEFRKFFRSKMDTYETPEKIAAWKKTWRAMKTGKLVRQPCACGNHESEAHHEDYSKPLEVTWLCTSCHQKLHYDARILAAELDTY